MMKNRTKECHGSVLRDALKSVWKWKSSQRNVRPSTSQRYSAMYQFLETSVHGDPQTPKSTVLSFTEVSGCIHPRIFSQWVGDDVIVSSIATRTNIAVTNSGKAQLQTVPVTSAFSDSESRVTLSLSSLSTSRMSTARIPQRCISVR